MAGVVGGAADYTDPDSVSRYLVIFDDLARPAVHDEVMRDLVLEPVAEYRR